MILRQYLWHALFQQRQISNPPLTVSDPSLPVSNLAALQANQLLHDSSPLPSWNNPPQVEPRSHRDCGEVSQVLDHWKTALMTGKEAVSILEESSCPI